MEKLIPELNLPWIKIRAAINDRVAAQSQILNRKVADIELTVESKLATLAEATQILAENRSTITELKNGIGELDKSVALMDKRFKADSREW